jgi:hypothetical protein
MSVRHLIPWIRKRDVTMSDATELDNPTCYIVKWIPKDQDVLIDHCTRYSDPSPAMRFAVNALQLSPKRIWIEDSKGAIHADHERILHPATFPASQHEARRVDNVLSQVDACPDEPTLTPTDLVDSGRAPKADEHVETTKLHLDESSSVSRHTVQVNQSPSEQDKQEQVNMVLGEIRRLLAEPPSTRTQQETASVIVSEIADSNAGPTVEAKSRNSATPDDIQRERNGREMSDTVRQEVEALLRISER